MDFLSTGVVTGIARKGGAAMVSASDPTAADGGPDKPDSSPNNDATRIVPGAQATARATAAPPVIAAPPSSRGHLQPGQMLAHTYEIEARLARGGMGEVYSARNVELRTRHAIKVIAPELINDARIIEMFTEEARKLRMVRDDAVVSYDGMFRDADGLLYLVMEFVDGVALGKVIRERRLDPNELRRLRDRLAQGLSAAHDKLIYHRDISPDNIILVDGRVEQAKIIDFGIAKAAGAGERTVIGSDFAGKYSYVSPEQLGMFGGDVDARSDIYSLGLVLAAAGLGRPLAMGDSPATAVEARRAIPDLSPLPADLRAELAPLLEPNPADRPRSMRELPGRHRSGTEREDRDAPPSAGRRQSPASPRSRMPLFAGLAVFAAALIAIGVYLFLPRASPPPAQNPAPAVAEATQPPLPESPPPPVAAIAPPVPTAPPVEAVDRAAIVTRVASLAQGFRCADLKPQLSDALDLGVSGFVTSAADQTKLSQALGEIPNLRHVVDSVAVRSWPQCAQMLKLMQDTGAFADAAAAPRFAFNIPSLDYHAGDKLVLRTTASAAFDGYLYVDFLDSAGNVAHLLPRPQGPSNAMRAGQTVTLGESKDSILEIAEPFGPNLVLAIFSPQRLFASRDDETAQAYLPVLARSLGALPHDAAARHASAAYAFIYTLQR